MILFNAPTGHAPTGNNVQPQANITIVIGLTGVLNSLPTEARPKDESQVR
jgi:hypothetical protein